MVFLNGYPVAPGRDVMNSFWRLAQRFKEDRRLALLVMLPNLAGIVGGYYYYWDVGQFNPSSTYFRAYGWWPFISDSPNAVLLASVAILLFAFGRRRSRLLDHLAFTSMVFVGCWTTMLFLLYPEQMGTSRFGSTNNILFITHMGMPIEALVFLPDLRRDGGAWWLAGIVAAWNALNLWLDYGPPPSPHLHPAPFLQPADAALHTWSPLLMLAVTLGWLAVVSPGLRSRGGQGTLPPASRHRSS